MSVHSSQRRRRRDHNRFKGMSHGEFMSRIRKTLYYGKLPMTDRLSLPVTEFAAELYSKVKAGKSFDRLRLEDAAEISRNTCVSPCSLVLAVLYLERLKTINPQYLDSTLPSELFLISVMVASKFLNDDGEDDEVLNSEWAASAGLNVKYVNRLEKEFLSAIGWEVFVNDASFWCNMRRLERRVAVSEGKKRGGWFSYSELEVLLDLIDTVTLAQTLLTLSMVCMASYTMGVLTMVGSTVLAAQLQSTAAAVTYLAATTTSTTPSTNTTGSTTSLSIPQLASPPELPLPAAYNNTGVPCQQHSLVFDNDLFDDWSHHTMLNESVGGRGRPTTAVDNHTFPDSSSPTLSSWFILSDNYYYADEGWDWNIMGIEEEGGGYSDYLGIVVNYLGQHIPKQISSRFHPQHVTTVLIK